MSDPRMPTRLAIFTSALGGGGVQRSMRNLAVGLVAAGYVVDLLVCHGDRGLAETLQAQGVNVQVLHRSTLPGLARLRALRADPAGWRALGPTVLWPIKTWQKLAYIAALRDYLAQERPAALCRP